MITADLKLLVDVAWANRGSQTAYKLARGEYAAADRLTKRDLLINAGGGTVGISAAGERIVHSFSMRIRKSYEEPNK